VAPKQGSTDLGLSAVLIGDRWPPKQLSLAARVVTAPDGATLDKGCHALRTDPIRRTQYVARSCPLGFSPERAARPRIVVAPARQCGAVHPTARFSNGAIWDNAIMQSKLRRWAERLDEACSRAIAEPKNQEARDELLSALIWNAVIPIDHLRPSLKRLVKEVSTERSTLWNRLKRPNETSADATAIEGGIERLQETLTALKQAIAEKNGARAFRRAPPEKSARHRSA
jgi:hypothetical protein